MYEIEGIVSTRDSCINFLNRLIPFFSKVEVLLKPKEQRFIKIDIPFIDEISGLAMNKLLDHKPSCTNMMRVKLVRNTGFLDVTKIHQNQ